MFGWIGKKIKPWENTHYEKEEYKKLMWVGKKHHGLFFKDYSKFEKSIDVLGDFLYNGNFDTHNTLILLKGHDKFCELLKIVRYIINSSVINSIKEVKGEDITDINTTCYLITNNCTSIRINTDIVKNSRYSFERGRKLYYKKYLDLGKCLYDANKNGWDKSYKEHRENTFIKIKRFVILGTPIISTLGVWTINYFK